jgi:hypothetical protein
MVRLSRILARPGPEINLPIYSPNPAVMPRLGRGIHALPFPTHEGLDPGATPRDDV